MNLCLRIVGLREDGYHLLESLVCPIDLADRITVEKKRSGGVQILCPGYEELERADNLAVKAAYWYAAVSKIPEAELNLKIEIEKRIPVAGGLGGGSSDAACVLRLLQRLYGFPVSSSQILSGCVELGADVPACFHGRCCWVGGIGEYIRGNVELEPCWFVLINPGYPVRTQWVYEKLGDIRLTKSSNDGRKPNRFLGRKAVAGLMRNDLESVTFLTFTDLLKMKEALLQQGAMKALMSGSGATLFGLFEEQDIASQAMLNLQRLFPEASLWMASNSNLESEDG